MIKVCDFDGPGRRGPLAEPRTYSGTLNGDASPAPPAYLARWKVFPANPPLHTVDGYPWNHPGHSTPARRGAGSRRPAATGSWGGFPLGARGTWDHDHKLNAPTLTTRGNNAKSATSWTQIRSSRARRSSCRSARPATTRSRGRTTGTTDDCEPTPEARRRHVGRLRGDGQPVRRPQPDARLVVLPRLHRAELERPGLQLRPHRAAAGERPDPRQRAGRSPDPASA